LIIPFNLLSGRYVETEIYPLRFQELLFNCDTHAMHTFSIDKGYIVTYDQEEQISENILVVPFWKFFSGSTFYA